jgi:phage shock protein C
MNEDIHSEKDQEEGHPKGDEGSKENEKANEGKSPDSQDDKLKDHIGSNDNAGSNHNADSNHSDSQQEQSEPLENEQPQNNKNISFQRLYRSKKNKIILGVCSGLGKYFNIDPVIFRLLFILSLLLGGWGILVYFIAGIILPYDPADSQQLQSDKFSSQAEASSTETAEERNNDMRENTRMVVGSSLILLGLFALLKSTGLIRYFSFFGLSNEIIMPVGLIAVGIFLIYRHNYFPYSEILEEDAEEYSPRTLYLSPYDKKISGVCGGLGKYFHVDSNLIRVFFLIFAFCSFGIGILIYFLFAFVVPKEENGVNLE